MADTPRLPPPVAEMSLDEQIALAEMQVIARDARIRHRTDVLARRIRHEAIKHAGGGALLGLATVGLSWWLNRMSRKNAPAPASTAAQQEPPHTFEHLFRDASLTLTALLPMLWPMLPRTWRRVVTPGTASTVLTFIAPLLGRLFRRRQGRAPSS
jgi:hypothetical protein